MGTLNSEGGHCQDFDIFVITEISCLKGSTGSESIEIKNTDANDPLKMRQEIPSSLSAFTKNLKKFKQHRLY